MKSVSSWGKGESVMSLLPLSSKSTLLHCPACDTVDCPWPAGPMSTFASARGTLQEEGNSFFLSVALLFLLAPVALDWQAEHAGEGAPPRQPSCRFLGTASGFLAGFPHGHLSWALLGLLSHSPPQGDFQQCHGCHTQLSDELSRIPCTLQQFPWKSNQLPSEFNSFQCMSLTSSSSPASDHWQWRSSGSGECSHCFNHTLCNS